MRKIGLDIETEAPDEATSLEFQEAFKLPLTPSKSSGVRDPFAPPEHALGRRLVLSHVRT